MATFINEDPIRQYDAETMSLKTKPALMRAQAKALIRSLPATTAEDLATQEDALALLDEADATELSNRPYATPPVYYTPEDRWVPQVTCGHAAGPEHL